MNNRIQFKTRLVAIQLVSQQLINKQNIENIKSDFDKHYRNTRIDNSSEKIKYNVSFKVNPHMWVPFRRTNRK